MPPVGQMVTDRIKIRCFNPVATIPELFFCFSVVVPMNFLPRYLLFITALVIPVAGPALGQADSLQGLSARGIQVVLTNSGFGLGGYISRKISSDHTISFEIILGATKDEREVAFFDRLGGRDVPNKANYLLEMPILVGIEQRLFRTQIEENFRPFIFASAGPVLGWSYPYFDDSNGNHILDTDEQSFDVISGLGHGHLEPGVSAGLFFGAHFGSPKTTSRGVRIGYRMSYYVNKIALLEETIKNPSRYIGTPVISVFFGRTYSR